MFKNLGAKTLGLAGHLSEIIELALSFGFRGTDLDIEEFAKQARGLGMDHARRLFESAGLKLGTFVLPVEWARTDEEFQKDLSQLGEMAEMAAELGCLRATTKISPFSEDRPMHDNFEFHRARFSDIASVLATHKIALGLEYQSSPSLRTDKPFEFIHNYEEALTLAKAVTSGEVGLVVDLWQLHATGTSLSVIDDLPLEKVVSVFVSDAPADVPVAELKPEQRLLPGSTGVIDIPQVLVGLQKRGYKGPITPNPHPKQFTVKRRDAVVRNTSHALEKIWLAADLPTKGIGAPSVAIAASV